MTLRVAVPAPRLHFNPHTRWRLPPLVTRHCQTLLAGADDIQSVVDKLHVPHLSRGGVDAIITDLDPKVNNDHV